MGWSYCLGSPLRQPFRSGDRQTAHREGTWYVIITLSSMWAISSQMGSWRTYLRKCPLSPKSACTLASLLFSEESMLPKYLLV